MIKRVGSESNINIVNQPPEEDLSQKAKTAAKSLQIDSTEVASLQNPPEVHCPAPPSYAESLNLEALNTAQIVASQQVNPRPSAPPADDMQVRPPPPSYVESMAAQPVVDEPSITTINKPEPPTDPDDMFKSLDGNMLKEKMDKLIFDKAEAGEISGDKFIRPFAKFINNTSELKKIGFKNKTEIMEFYARLNPFFDRDKVQSNEKWREEIFDIIDAFFLAEKRDYTAFNENVYEMGLKEGEGGIIRNKKDWEDNRNAVLARMNNTEMKDDKEDDKTKKTSTSQKSPGTSPTKSSNKANSAGKPDPMKEAIKELAEQQAQDIEEADKKRDFQKELVEKRKKLGF